MMLGAAPGASQPFPRGPTMQDRLTQLEILVAHLTRTVEDLSDIVARQSREIDTLNRRVGLLMEREAEREAEGGAIPLADQRPPHW